MGVKSVTYDWMADRAGGDRASRGWLVEFLLLGGSAVAALAAKGIPRKNDRHPNDSLLIAGQPQAEPLSLDGRFYRVTVEYALPPGIQRPYVPPVYRPAEVRWSWVSSTEQVDVDVDGKAITNSAGQPFDPPLSEEFLDPLLTIVKNEIRDDLALRIKYAMAINSDAFYGGAPGEVRCNGIEAEQLRDWFNVWWRKTYTFQFRSGGEKAWQRRVLDQGCKKLVTDAAGVQTLAAILDADGREITSPVKLDGKGGVLAEGRKAVALQFKTKKVLPFAIFRLGGKSDAMVPLKSSMTFATVPSVYGG